MVLTVWYITKRIRNEVFSCPEQREICIMQVHSFPGISITPLIQKLLLGDVVCMVKTCRTGAQKSISPPYDTNLHKRLELWINYCISSLKLRTELDCFVSPHTWPLPTKFPSIKTHSCKMSPRYFSLPWRFWSLPRFMLQPASTKSSESYMKTQYLSITVILYN